MLVECPGVLLRLDSQEAQSPEAGEAVARQWLCMAVMSFTGPWPSDPCLQRPLGLRGHVTLYSGGHAALELQ